MKKNERTKRIVLCVILGMIGVSAMACIIISMVTGKVTPYLAMGLALACIGNAIGTVTIWKRKGIENESGKDGNIS